MRRKTIILLATCFLFSTISVFALFLITHSDSTAYNSFVRYFAPHPLSNEQITDIKYNSYYIAGAAGDKVYLGNMVGPLHLLELNSNVPSDTHHISLSIGGRDKYKFKSITVKVAAPYFYVTDGNMPGMFRGKIGEWKATKYVYDSVFFTEAVPISASSYIARAINSQTQGYALAKVTDTKPHVKFNLNLLQKQIDGIFCTDGLLLHNEPNRLVYVYFYRNEFICMDSSLNLLYRGNTIDTISRVKIKTDRIRSENSITMSAPPLTVNKQSCTVGNWLFINSDLRAKNESQQSFSTASVIDVYNLQSGKYAFSFHIKNYNGNKLKGFRVFENKLIILTDHYLLTYDLSADNFSNRL